MTPRGGRGSPASWGRSGLGVPAALAFVPAKDGSGPRNSVPRGLRETSYPVAGWRSRVLLVGNLARFVDNYIRAKLKSLLRACFIPNRLSSRSVDNLCHQLAGYGHPQIDAQAVD
jgi:hypothetical protein